MSTEAVLTLSVGAVLQSSVMAVFGGAQKVVKNLGNEITSLRLKQNELGAAIEKHMGMLSAKTLAPMTMQYQRMGDAIARATERQYKLNAATEKQRHYAERRQQLRTEGKEAIGTAIAVMAPVTASVKAFMTQEQAATDMKIAYMKAGGEVGEAFEQLKKQAIDLGNEFPGTTADFLRLGQVLKEQGVRDQAVVGGGMRAAASFNVLMNTPQEAGGEIVAKLMEARGIDDKDLVKAVDQMQRAKFAFGMKPEDLKTAMSYDAPTTNILGLKGLANQEKLLALQGMGAQVGLENSSWGTNFAMMLTRMSKGVRGVEGANKGEKAHADDLMKQAGVSMDFFDKGGKFLGLENMTRQLEKLKVIKDKFGEDGALSVANAIFGQEAGRAAMIIGDKGAAGLEANIQKMREQASLQERMAEKSKTLSNAAESFFGTITNGMASVGEVYAGDLRDFFMSANHFISDTLVPWVQNHKTLIGLTTKFVGGLLLGKIAFIGIAYALNLFATPFLALSTGLNMFKGALSVIELVRLGQISKLAGMLQLVGVHAEKAGKWAHNLGKLGGGTLDFAKAAPMRVWNAAKQAPSAIFNGVKRGAVGAVQMGKAAGVGTWNMGKSIVGGTLNIGKSVALGGLKGIGATIRAILHPVQTLMSGLRGIGAVGRMVGFALQTAFRVALGAIMGISWPVVLVVGAIAATAFLIYKYWAPIKAFFAGVWQGLKAGLQPLTPLFTAIGVVAGKMFAPLRPVWNWLKSGLAVVVDWFGKLFQQEEDVGGGAKNMGVRVGQAIAGFINGAVRLATTVITKFGQVVDWFKALPSRFVEFGKNIMQGLLDGISSMFDKVVGKIKSVGSAIKRAFTGSGEGGQDIHSPSRIWRGYGGFLMGGLGIGIDQEKNSILGRIAQLGRGIQSAFAPKLNVPNAQVSAIRAAIDKAKTGIFGTGNGGVTSAKNGGIHIQFSPQITIQGASGQNIEQQVQNGLQWSLRELESMINRIAEDKLRKAF